MLRQLTKCREIKMKFTSLVQQLGAIKVHQENELKGALLNIFEEESEEWHAGLPDIAWSPQKL